MSTMDQHSAPGSPDELPAPSGDGSNEMQRLFDEAQSGGETQPRQLSARELAMQADARLFETGQTVSIMTADGMVPAQVTETRQENNEMEGREFQYVHVFFEATDRDNRGLGKVQQDEWVRADKLGRMQLTDKEVLDSLKGTAADHRAIYPQKRIQFESPDAPEGMVKERLHGLRDAISEAQEEYPEILGATIFGSSTQGRAREASDIDGFLFVDVDAAEKAGRPVKIWDDGPTSGLKPNPFESPYRQAVVERVTDNQKLERGQLGDFREVVISPKIVSDAVGAAAEAATKEMEFRAEIDELPPNQRDAQLKAIDELIDMRADLTNAGVSKEEIQLKREAYIESLPAIIDRTRLEPPRIPVSWNIRALFHMGIKNQPLAPYRKQVLRELQELGPTGEKVWSVLASKLHYFEGSVRRGSFYFPLNLADAAEQYGVDD